jgi:hypothetical protein
MVAPDITLAENTAMKLYGDYLKRCPLTHRVSQILLLTLLTRLISERKVSTTPKGFLSTHGTNTSGPGVTDEEKSFITLTPEVHVRRSRRISCQHGG